MTEIGNGHSALFLFPASFLVMVKSSFSKELTVCEYAVPKSFGRSKVRLAGFAVYCFIPLILLSMCSAFS